MQKGGEKVPMSGLNPQPPILQPMSLPLNYAYVFIIAIANLIFNDVTVAALTMPIITFMSQVHEVKLREPQLTEKLSIAIFPSTYHVHVRRISQGFYPKFKVF